LPTNTNAFFKDLYLFEATPVWNSKRKNDFSFVVRCLIRKFAAGKHVIKDYKDND